MSKLKGSLDENWSEQHYNGFPCGNSECGSNKPCSHCGRVELRGNVLIQNRTGYVHLERLNPVNKKIYLKLKKEDQETHTIKLWIGPNESFEL